MYKYNVSNHIEKVKNEVAKLLEGDNSGHGLEHINRVLDLSLKFAEKENANKYDIIHCHVANAGAIFLYYAKKYGIKNALFPVLFLVILQVSLEKTGG